MRALSDNMTSFDFFLSTPKLVSDLLFLSDLLKNVEKERRNYYLNLLILFHSEMFVIDDDI